MKTYKELKEEARQMAIDWQYNYNDNNYSYYELAWWAAYFEKLGGRYGLLKEFKENSII